ncbi:MAG: hypothetical protein IPO35_17465 [Uliginosibacterium sp.]|nr:hypothetical protein [Uliginosibacterium sp.]
MPNKNQCLHLLYPSVADAVFEQCYGIDFACVSTVSSLIAGKNKRYKKKPVKTAISAQKHLLLVLIVAVFLSADSKKHP